MTQNITMKHLNVLGEYDTMYPKTSVDQVVGLTSAAVVNVTYPVGSTITAYQLDGSSQINLQTAPNTTGSWVMFPNAYGFWYFDKNGANTVFLDIDAVKTYTLTIS